MVRKDLPEEIRSWVGQQLFDHVPSNIIVINRDFEVVTANEAFTNVFGEAVGKRCYEAFKKKPVACEHCMAAQTFEDGQAHVSNAYGVDRDGRSGYYVVHNAPIYNGSGEVIYVIEMSYDVTDIKSLQRQYNILFERVPCYVAVLDRDFKIVRMWLFKSLPGSNYKSKDIRDQMIWEQIRPQTGVSNYSHCG